MLTSWGGDTLEAAGVFISEAVEVAPGIWCSGLLVLSVVTATLFLFHETQNRTRLNDYKVDLSHQIGL